MDDHLSAIITIIGMTCDVMGGLYLAYDLLGGENGPLALLTKIINYSVLMTVLMIPTMGLKFALIVGFGFGTVLGLHFDRIGRSIPDTNKFLLLGAIIRGTAIFSAVWITSNHTTAIVMAIIVCGMSFLLPKLHISPTSVYKSSKRPQLNLRQLGMAAAILLVAMCSGLFGASIAHGDAHTFSFVMRFALTFAFTVLIVTSFSPLIEWYSDHLPAKSFGTAGVALFIAGFVIQSLPSFATIFDVAK